jgi:ubiquitin C-terminal hydrolase
LGNTCFFNSSIQCLYATELLHIAYATFKLDLDAEFDKVGELSILFGKFLRNQEKFFTPKALFSWVCRMKGQYKHMDQQDAQ